MECVICLDPLFKSKEGLATLQCGHLFHNSCLVKSLGTNPACPICRKAASKEQIIKIYLDSDSDGALGQCKDCAKNKKEWEEYLEKVINGIDGLVGSHKNEKQKLKAKIESLKQELGNEKQMRELPEQENKSVTPKIAKKPEPQPVEDKVTKESVTQEEKALEISEELPPPPHSIVKKEELQEKDDKISIEGYTIEVFGGYAPSCYLTTYDNGTFKIEIEAENLQDVWESVEVYPRNNCMHITVPALEEGNPFKRLIRIQANAGKSVKNLQKQYFRDNEARIVIDLK